MRGRETGHSRSVNTILTDNRLRNPVPIECVPIAVGVGALAITANEGSSGCAAVAPTPAHGGQVLAAGGLVANRANFSLSERFRSGLACGKGLLLADVTIFNAHRRDNVCLSNMLVLPFTPHLCRSLRQIFGPVYQR